MHVGQKLVSKFYTFEIGRWVFSSTLDLNQTTAKETTSSPFIFYYIGISKPHSLFIPCHHPFAGCLFSSFPRFLPFFNVFAKGRLRSESRQEDHVIRLWYYVCTNCISTKKKGSRKKATNNLVFHAKLRFSFLYILPKIKWWMKVWENIRYIIPDEEIESNWIWM